MTETLAALATEVLNTKDALAKTKVSRQIAQHWRDARDRDEPMDIGVASPPDFPARPDKPELLLPRDVPKRKTGSIEGRAALLHAVAHIELNAVDLHWDIIARFSQSSLPFGFFDDWVKAADEESKHFQLMSKCLNSHGFSYGDLPAHAGMWRAAEDTKDDLFGRLAVVPMVLEARGLDVTPGMIKIFEKAKDELAIDALNVIYAEEVAHVAYGSKWFHFLCGRENIDPKPMFHSLVRKYFHSTLRPPFNEEKRAEAGIAPDFYWPLADEMETPAALR